MSTLTSASTTAQIEAAYDDNASYAEDRSTSKCKTFITACRILIRRYVPESSKGDARVGLTARVQQLREELAEARDWLAAHAALDTAASADHVRHFELTEDFRV